MHTLLPSTPEGAAQDIRETAVGKAWEGAWKSSGFLPAKGRIPENNSFLSTVWMDKQGQTKAPKAVLPAHTCQLLSAFPVSGTRISTFSIHHFMLCSDTYKLGGIIPPHSDRWRHWGTVWLCNLTKVTQWASSRASIWILAFCIQILDKSLLTVFPVWCQLIINSFLFFQVWFLWWFGWKWSS